MGEARAEGEEEKTLNSDYSICFWMFDVEVLEAK